MAKQAKPLKVKTITFARLKNTGNYENDRLEMTVEVAAGDDVVAVTNKLKQTSSSFS